MKEKDHVLEFLRKAAEGFEPNATPEQVDLFVCAFTITMMQLQAEADSNKSDGKKPH